MRPLDLDFCSPRRSRWAPYVLALAAVGFATDSGLRYRSARADIDAKQLRLAKGAQVREAPAKSSTEAGEERAFARQTVRKLTMPWDELFDALEASASERIALLTIEPDAEAHTVSLSGEAKDYLSALTYVANLGEQKTLGKVHLVRHEVRQSGAIRPVTFVVSATWGNDQ